MSDTTSASIPVLLIMGPTGAGKTDLAIRLAERFPIEIVSVDSAMVYRGMDIGTGKPAPAVLEQFPHHLVDILDPSDAYSAGRFVRDACSAIYEIHARGRLPVLVGGTMLYFRALRKGMADLPSADPTIRTQIDTEARSLGWPALHAELALIDARSAARIQPNDAQRIQRALEVFRITGKTLSEFHAELQKPDPNLLFSPYAWLPSDRERLYASIRGRFLEMLRTGFIEEVRRLRERPDLHADLPAIRAVGYRQIWEHLDGRAALDDAIENAIVATRHLARRQLIWLRGDAEAHTVDSLEPDAFAHIEREVERLCASIA